MRSSNPRLDARDDYVAAPAKFGRFISRAGVIAGLSLLLVFGSRAKADESPTYNREIRPILADNCFACHGADSAARKGDLRLDVREAAIDSAAITAGEPDESELLARVLSDDPDLVMPPPETKKQLTEEQKELLRRWIAAGAEYERHWSLIAPTKPKLPSVKNNAWVKNPIDRFVLSRLEKKSLSPAPEAGARRLFRRLHLDVTGLPPNPKDAASFEADYKANGEQALSDWVEKLMKSTDWGEHRGRYWLDAARYGDTHGLHFDNYREMWPYRDWVIRAFNANQPFDQFTVEQIAGDLLANPTENQLIATGFQRCNITTNEGGTIDEENLANYAADRVQTFGWVYLGMTTNCGQCHDHKFDPFTTRDYYSLAAFFRNTTQLAKDGNVKDGRGPTIVTPTEADKPRWKSLPAEIASAKASRDERRKYARGEFKTWLASVATKSLEKALPTEDLVVHVPLTEGAGDEVSNAAAESVKFKSTGKVTWTPEGKFGPAPLMKLGGTFELGDLGDFEKDEQFSCGAWIKAGRNNVFGGIIARMDERGGYRGWDLWQNGGALAVHIVDSWPNNGLKVTTQKSVLKPGEWQHVIMTYDGSSKPQGVKIYINGREEKLKVETNTLKPDATIRTDTPTRIGQRSHTQVFDGGSVQDLRIYARKLSKADVKAIAEIAPLQTILATAVEQRTPEQKAALFNHYLTTRDEKFLALEKSVVALEAERETIRARSPITHVQQERKGAAAMARILMRGAYDKPGEEVSAAPPTALHALPTGAPPNRLGLAQWVVDPANPLTARVTVNRFWQQVFGKGIVGTTEDFGVMGDLPSHPELLDWLAVEFRDSGWDVKRLFKLMLMSATYRQAAITTANKLERDRDNMLLSRGPRFRMDAEMVRDNALFVSGLLSRKMYGPGAKPYQPDDIWSIVGVPGGDTRNYEQDKGENLYRRTIYTFWKRMAPPPNLEAFNAPSREVCTVRRERTNTPLQALVTLNDPQFIEAARRLAENAMSAGGGDDEKILNQISHRVLSRPLRVREMSILTSGKQELLAYYRSKIDDARALIAVGDSNPNEKHDASQLAAWTMICNQVMNLDETLNK